MKCLKCDKEAFLGNYCEDHAAEIGSIHGEVNVERNGDIHNFDAPCVIDEKPEKASK